MTLQPLEKCLQMCIASFFFLGGGGAAHAWHTPGPPMVPELPKTSGTSIELPMTRRVKEEEEEGLVGVVTVARRRQCK